MALYRLETKIISRRRGRSVIAAAAYRSGEILTDERTGTIHDYTRRNGVLFAGIFAPKEAPAWMRERPQLWNHVEKMEKRVDARLAREYLVSLPYELTEEQRFRLVRDFVRERFVRRGLVADVAIHAPSHDGDDRNFHAHILVSERQATAMGFARHKFTEINTKTDLYHTRKAWRDHCNRALRQAGLALRVDHRPKARAAVSFYSAARAMTFRQPGAALPVTGCYGVRPSKPLIRGIGHYHQIRRLTVSSAQTGAPVVRPAASAEGNGTVWDLFLHHKRQGTLHVFFALFPHLAR